MSTHSASKHSKSGPAGRDTSQPEETVDAHVYFSFDDVGSVLDYVAEMDLLPTEPDAPTVQRAGDGNMNFVARVKAGDESVILKQSRPWVEKYPSIEAPAGRIMTEIAFYEEIAGDDRLAEGMPRLIFPDPSNLVAVFEDLGDAPDYTSIYGRGQDGANLEPDALMSDLRDLLRWLGALHDHEIADTPGRFENRAMRDLNHAHIFEIPLDPNNGVDLDAITPGLDSPASRLRSDDAYREAVAELGRMYLSDGDTLLHGDYYPGSWVRSEDGPKVIDPEFAFRGRPEFDVGICRAHLLLAGMSTNELEDAFDAYEAAAGIDLSVVDGFAGTEIMRRLIGVAQLPLDRSAADKEALLSLSRELILGSGF